eukprot:6941411-Prymnesium_polylepis.1
MVSYVGSGVPGAAAAAGLVPLSAGGAMVVVMEAEETAGVRAMAVVVVAVRAGVVMEEAMA